MEVTGIIQKIRHRIEDDQHWLTRQKLAVLGATLVVIGISMGAFESGQAPPEKTTYTEIVELALPDRLPHRRQIEIVKKQAAWNHHPGRLMAGRLMTGQMTNGMSLSSAPARHST